MALARRGAWSGASPKLPAVAWGFRLRRACGARPSAAAGCGLCRSGYIASREAHVVRSGAGPQAPCGRMGFQIMARLRRSPFCCRRACAAPYPHEPRERRCITTAFSMTPRRSRSDICFHATTNRTDNPMRFFRHQVGLFQKVYYLPTTFFVSQNL